MNDFDYHLHEPESTGAGIVGAADGAHINPVGTAVGYTDGLDMATRIAVGTGYNPEYNKKSRNYFD